MSFIGACSNLIIRDGGLSGAVVKLGKNFSNIDHDPSTGIISAGAGAMDVLVARYGAKQGLGGLEFLSGIPGTIGGALRMNAGAYGREVKDILIDARVMNRDGLIETVSANAMDLTYRHNGLPDDVIFLSARFQTYPEKMETIEARLTEIKEQREETQPVKDRTGGSTFANPEGEKAWRLVEAVGGRGLKIGGAQFSEKHCNFMINTGDASAADLENLGEEVRSRVLDQFGISLRWEIKRIGNE